MPGISPINHFPLVNDGSLLNQIPVPEGALTFEGKTEPLTFEGELEIITFEK